MSIVQVASVNPLINELCMYVCMYVIMFRVGADYVSMGRDYDSLSLGGYRRSSCYAAASAGSLSTHHHADNAAGRSSVGQSQHV